MPAMHATCRTAWRIAKEHLVAGERLTAAATSARFDALSLCLVHLHGYGGQGPFHGSTSSAGGRMPERTLVRIVVRIVVVRVVVVRVVVRVGFAPCFPVTISHALMRLRIHRLCVKPNLECRRKSTLPVPIVCIGGSRLGHERVSEEEWRPAMQGTVARPRRRAHNEFRSSK